MFSDALEKARLFTFPLIQSVRYFDGTVQSGAAACVVVNADGWIVTAAHMLDAFMAAQQHANEILAQQQAAAAIKADPRLKSGERHKQLRRVRENPKWVTNTHSVAFVGNSGRELVDWTAARDIDLAVARIQPFDPSWVQALPIFKNPKKIRQGTSLCRLGYPFVKIDCAFDTTKSMFSLSSPGLPFFPNEGIFAREVLGPKSPNGPFGVRFIETSSPGLKGQSGGPLFDIHGTVWGIQSQTQHLDLGFNPNLHLADGKEVEVHQFMNVGWAVHPATIHEFLTYAGVAFQAEP
jgi:hypothetical protein